MSVAVIHGLVGGGFIRSGPESRGQREGREGSASYS